MVLASLLMTSALLLIFLILVHPLLATFSPKPLGKDWALAQVKVAVQLAFFVSLLPVVLLLNGDTNEIITNWNWVITLVFDAEISFKFDVYSVIFIPVALYVTWAILEFSTWYMKVDKHINVFFKYLLVFLIAMIIMVTANNLFQLFIGWEGVGIMSFLLIGWWHGRSDANTAALQAVIYNRIGDLGVLCVLVWTATNLNSWDLEVFFSLTKSTDFTLPLLGLILAAAGKSAQFGLHPWLPAAMEGPTPVSALLHSSTMVVAGIFLLVRMTPALQTSPTALTICLCLGGATTLFTALCALTQNDLKKIVAFSTSSQLGLMMVSIGLNQPELTFLHICTHAFFKAMLFLCSASFIHFMQDEQDIRKISGLYGFTPFTASCLIIGSLALMGTPFLAAFYSKDAILEAMSTSQTNSWALALTLLATCFTAMYSLRLIYYVVLSFPRFSPFAPVSEEYLAMVKPIKRLAWGSIIAGLLLTIYLVPQKTPVLTVTPMIKMGAIFVTVVGLLVAYELASKTNQQQEPTPEGATHAFSTMLGFYPHIVHRFYPKLSLFLGQGLATGMIDLTWLDKLGPKALATLGTPMVKFTNDIQRGVIKAYLSIFFISLFIFMFIF